MGSALAICSLLQAVSCPFKRYLQSGLMFLNPLTNRPTNRTLDSPQQEVDRQAWFLTKHQEKGGFPCHLVGSSVVTVQFLGEICIPVPFSGDGQGTQQIVEGAVKPTVPLRMI